MDVTAAAKGQARSLGPVPTSAAWLGMAGAVPFVVLALVGFMDGAAGILARLMLLGYAVAILSFMGGVHWGLAMARGEAKMARLGPSVAPALVAWAGFLVGGRPGLWILAAAFAGLLAYDLSEVRRGAAPGWYPRLRWPLTAIVVISLVVASIAA